MNHIKCVIILKLKAIIKYKIFDAIYEKVNYFDQIIK